MKAPTPTALKSEHVELLPIASSHAAQFAEIGRDASIWTYLAPEPFTSVADAQRWIEGMLKRPEYAVTYSVFDVASGALAGSSSYLNVSEPNEHLEIGFTWYGKSFQRTHINTATKRLLLAQAFEVLHATRVQLQTDGRNKASQKAIARIGGVKEGVLRRNKKHPNGYIRDSVVFSILKEEWPSVRDKLDQILAG